MKVNNCDTIYVAHLQNSEEQNLLENNFNASFEAAFKVALSSTTSQYLSF